MDHCLQRLGLVAFAAGLSACAAITGLSTFEPEKGASPIVGDEESKGNTVTADAAGDGTNATGDGSASSHVEVDASAEAGDDAGPGVCSVGRVECDGGCCAADGGSADGADGASSDGSADACTPVDVPPSLNVDATQWAAKLKTSPTWVCDGSGTTTIDSATGAVTGDTCGGTATLDATNNVAQTNGGPNVMVVRLRGLTVVNKHVLTLTGDKPIVFLVSGNVHLDSGAKVTAGARSTTAGPGGDVAANCAGSTGASNTNGQCGGGGGGFGAPGGYGADVGGAQSVRGGAISASSNLQPLRGGCAGGSGGAGAGAAGAGGGAFEISASGTIVIGTGTSSASLSAAGGGSPAVTNGNNVGSGGGGSGGAILLVSPALATFGPKGVARAHGGASGAAAGCQCNQASSADNGQDGHAGDDTAAAGGPSADINGAAGANGGLCAGAGCSTASTGGDNGAGAQVPMSGSGGGGGAGRVVVTTGAATSICN